MSLNLDKKQCDLLDKILKKHLPKKTVWAYGSRVNGGSSKKSDLDIVVFDCTPEQVLDLKSALEESCLLVSVDVMDWNCISDSFKQNIKKQYMVLQSNQS